MKQIRKLLAMLAMIFFCLAAPVIVEAEEINIPDGFVIGDDQGLSVTENGGYFFNLSGLMPGDIITRNLVIQNNRSDDYRLKMIIAPKSHEGPVNLIESMSMKFTYSSTVIYDGNLSSDENGETVESRELDFGIIPAGSTQTMEIELKVLRNIPFDEFMSGPSEAIVTWTFMAERDTEPSTSDSTDPTTPSTSDTTGPTTPSTTQPSTTKPSGSYPSTGETYSKILFTLGGIFLIITGILFYLFYIRKEKDEAAH
ncbi:LPXTG cell wall anchor domain-containing protein [Enterococcus sp. BWR-S5]|uniref:LPXTG cell wall anchor domain-containing protein n=1 Tax=Enterococcus sp. BWR-S5 TaxID=2787714 RepID=UPI0019237B4A|nr:LPXTG cell wall anchor domain-containing protein [Enterococcus sp. BWR-S5]MBL1226777.1 LPXTG cell wall anchor domain-containing protein [Enterococcus sp. BWR-S5]